MNTNDAVITLHSLVDNLRQWLDRPDSPIIINDAEIASIYAETIKDIEEYNLVDRDSSLFGSLNIIKERLTSGDLKIVIAELSSLLAAIINYIDGKHLDKSVELLSGYLPEELADKHSAILHMEAQLLSTLHNSDLDDTTPPAYTESHTQINDLTGLAIQPPLKLAMQSEITELKALLEETDDGSDQETLYEGVMNHLDNLAFIAKGLGSDKLLKILESMYASALEPNGNPKLLSKLALIKSLNSLDELLQSSDTITNRALTQTATTSISDDSPIVENIVFTDERLEMLHEELSYYDEQLDSQSAILTSDDSTEETLLTYADKYSELVERLVKACDALGLQGLKRIGSFVIKNVKLLPSLAVTERTQLRPLLLRWPHIVKRYLVDPSDDPILMELIEMMQHRLWPACFDGLDSRDLYVELSNGADKDIVEENEIRPAQINPEDVSLDFSADINPQLRDSYLLESPDVAAQFSQAISSLSTSPNPFEIMRSAQRLSHTLKGSANLVGIKGVANLAHHIEDILEIMSRKGIVPSSPLITLLQEAADCLEGMLDAVAGIANAPTESVKILLKVIDVANRLYSDSLDLSEDILHDSDIAPLADTSERHNDAIQPPLSAISAADTIRVPTTTIDTIFRLVEEITISLSQIHERVNRTIIHSDLLNKHDRNLQLRRFDLENLVDVRSMASMQKRLHRGIRSDDSFDPLELDQYDKLHGATHSYIEAVADARQFSNTIHNDLMGIVQLMTRHSRLNKELQHIVSKSRMVAISNISSRLHRTVRQAARATGKNANLDFIHNNLLMDSDVLNKLIEPLSHILRNAVDHGMPDHTESSESGKITVTFGQEGNNMAIRCADDGKGLDYARIQEVAIERGIITAGQQMSHDDLSQLIMLPAFTTRETVTHVSGRGIGLDAALAAITELKGSITIGEVTPHGTEFVIRLPLSLVTTHTLVVQAGGAAYAIPTSALFRILPAKRGKITEADGNHTLHFNGESYSLRTLSSLVERDISAPSESNPILLTGIGTTTTAIAVDALLDSFELVIKRLGRIAPRVPGIIGVSVLSDGQLVPVLDIPGLLSIASSLGGASTSYLSEDAKKFTARTPISKRHVLVVDDSLSARNSLVHLLEDGGYFVQSARDGVEAVEMLQRAKPLAVLADMEMPRMDGIELTRHIRANKEMSELPVVMITSRSQKKHRDIADAAGVSAYVTKPYVDNELIDLVSNLVSQQ